MLACRLRNQFLSLSDYTLDQSGVDWSTCLQNWAWLLPREFTLWLVNRFSDLFIILDDGTVHMLDVGAGTLKQVARSREEFGEKIDEADNSDYWLMIPLVDQLVASGILLGPGQCYALRQPTVLGGECVPSNVVVMGIERYLAGFGSIHEQIKDVPDGTHVAIRPKID
jgi:hypothetical protein